MTFLAVFKCDFCKARTAETEIQSQDDWKRAELPPNWYMLRQPTEGLTNTYKHLCDKCAASLMNGEAG